MLDRDITERTHLGLWYVLHRVKRAARVIVLAALVAGVLTGCMPPSASGPQRLEARLIASGFASPVQLIGAPDHSGRLFVVDQIGVIWILVNGKRIKEPFLDIRDRLVQLLPFYDERGLLALAFHPDFASNGRFFVYYSARLRPGLSPTAWDHTTRVSEFTVSAQNPNEADPNTERVLLSIDKPGYNFEGGGLAFGPDGYLYIGTGDSVPDPSTEAGKYAQDKTSLLGKILRIDVNTSGTDVSGATNGESYHIPPDNPFIHTVARPEVFALGFRNPYRLTFDTMQPGTPPRLFVTDVGQAVMEEADLVVRAGNYGWPIREGTTCFNTNNWIKPLPRCNTAGLTDPIFEYPHAGKASAIIGGVIYRGTMLSGLYGDFVFGDWGRGPQSLFAATPDTGGSDSWHVQHLTIDIPEAQGSQLLGIGTDANNELYLLSKDPGIGPVGSSGKVYAIIGP